MDVMFTGYDYHLKEDEPKTETKEDKK